LILNIFYRYMQELPKAANRHPPSQLSAGPAKIRGIQLDVNVKLALG
jgi:hypothetical protein